MGTVLSWAPLILAFLDCTTHGEYRESAKDILDRIYGPDFDDDVKVNMKYSEKQRAYNSEFPMIGIGFFVEFTDQDFKKGRDYIRGLGVIIDKKAAVSKCTSYYQEENGKIVPKKDKSTASESLRFEVFEAATFLPSSIQDSEKKVQRTTVTKLIPHRECRRTFHPFDHNNILLYDSVILQFRAPLLFNEYVQPMNFYSFDVEEIEDRIEEYQEINKVCRLVVPKSKTLLYASNVQVVSNIECNNILCMLGLKLGITCRKPLDYYDLGLFCTLIRSLSNDNNPCYPEFEGVLICSGEVLGFQMTRDIDLCEICKPHLIEKPNNWLKHVEHYLTQKSTTEHQALENGTTSSPGQEKNTSSRSEP